MINNYVIIIQDNRPPIPDVARHIIYTFDYYDYFVNQPLSFIKNYQSIALGFHSPVLLLSALPLILAFGKNLDIISMTNSFYFLILIFSVYGIGKRLKDANTGLLAAFIVSTFPVVFGLSRIFLEEFILTAIVSLSIYLMLLTDRFGSFKYSVLFGVSLGLGMLTKFTYPVFIAGPFLYYIGISFLGKSKTFCLDRSKFCFFMSIAIGCILVATWYLDVTTREEFGGWWTATDLFPTIPTIDVLTFYFSVGLLVQIHSFYFILFSVSFAYSICKREWKNYFLIIGILVPYLLFSFHPIKYIRYTAPVLPIIAVMIAVMLSEVRKTRFRKILFLSVVVIGLMQFFLVSYNISPNFLALYEDNDDRIHVGILYAWQEDWHEEDIINILSEHEVGDKTESILSISMYHPLLAQDTLILQAIMHNKTFIINSPLDCISVQSLNINHCNTSYAAMVSDADFVLVADDIIILEALSGESELLSINQRQIIQAFEKKKEDFEQIGTYKSPENHEIFIYKRK